LECYLHGGDLFGRANFYLRIRKTALKRRLWPLVVFFFSNDKERQHNNGAS